MSTSCKRTRLWALLAVLAVGCADNEPHSGAGGGAGNGGSSGSAGSSGADTGGTAAGGYASSGTGGGATPPPCPIAVGGAGAGGGADDAPDGQWCSGAQMYCFTKDSRTCVCTQNGWLCFGGVDPLDSTETVLTGSYRGHDNQACLACAQAQCSSLPKWPCEQSGSGAACFHLLACELESACPRAPEGVKSCYCGTAASDSDCLYTKDANGVCMREEATTWTAPLTVLTSYFDASTSSGAANGFARCLAENCASCFQGDTESCPTVSAFSVQESVTVGENAALAVVASDSNPGASPIRFSWGVKPTYAGVIEDEHAANTTWHCLSGGIANVTVRVGNADAACAWTTSRKVACNEARCELIPLQASARAAFIGETITLSIVPQNATPLQIEWATPPDGTGSLSGDGNSATYTCANAGIATITVTTTQGTCTLPQSVSVTCVERSAGPSPDSSESALKRLYLGQDNEDCWSCAQSSACLNPAGTLPCEYRVDPAERALCLRVLACELESGCVSSVPTCYNTGGVCRTQLEEALQTRDVSDVSSHFIDVQRPGAQANILSQCLMRNNCASCFPPPNQCPIIETVSAAPSTAGIGEPIALSVVATDPDDGPHPLSYLWIPAHTDAGYTGVISDPRAPDTTFSCELVGETEVAINVLDGECGDTEYVPITCVE